MVKDCSVVDGSRKKSEIKLNTDTSHYKVK